jgi:hypothetical protein
MERVAIGSGVTTEVSAIELPMRPEKTEVGISFKAHGHELIRKGHLDVGPRAAPMDLNGPNGVRVYSAIAYSVRASRK